MLLLLLLLQAKLNELFELHPYSSHITHRLLLHGCKSVKRSTAGTASLIVIGAVIHPMYLCEGKCNLQAARLYYNTVSSGPAGGAT